VDPFFYLKLPGVPLFPLSLLLISGASLGTLFRVYANYSPFTRPSRLKGSFPPPVMRRGRSPAQWIASLFLVNLPPPYALILGALTSPPVHFLLHWTFARHTRMVSGFQDVGGIYFFFYSQMLPLQTNLLTLDRLLVRRPARRTFAGGTDFSVFSLCSFASHPADVFPLACMSTAYLLTPGFLSQLSTRS